MAQASFGRQRDFDTSEGYQPSEFRPEVISAPIQPVEMHIDDNKRLTNSEAGLRLTLLEPSQPAVTMPKSLPTYTVPTSFQSKVLDRKRELSLASKALQTGQSVEFYGPPGSGKSTLLHHLARHISQTAFADGIVTLSAQQRNLEDLQQLIFDTFYQHNNLKITFSEAKKRLQDKQALLLIDDVTLSQTDLEKLIALAPKSAFLMASTEHHSWTQWQTIPVSELPVDDALRLAERALGRKPTTEEMPTIQAICHLLNHQPLSILQILSFFKAKTANENQPFSLVTLAGQLRQAPANQEIAALLLSDLSDDEQKVLGILAVLGNAPLTAAHLADLSSISNVQPILTALASRYLVTPTGERFSLPGNLRDVLAETLDLNPGFEQALTHFTSWAEHHQATPRTVFDETDTVLALLQQAIKRERWRPALRLVRAVENVVFLGRRWGSWTRIVKWGLLAARHLEDQSAEAWALHQLGTGAYCLGDESQAIDYLKEALQIRASLADQVSVELTRHNLDLIGGEGVLANIPLGGGGGSGGNLPPQGPLSPAAFYAEHRTPTQTGLNFARWTRSCLGILIILLLVVAVVVLSRIALSLPNSSQNITASTPTEERGLQFNTRRLNFSPLAAGQDSPSQTIIVTNNSDNNLPFSPDYVLITGEDAASFQAQTACGPTLAPQESCSINVSFQPQITGGQQAVLMIAHSTQTIELNGGQPIQLAIQPTQIQFGHHLLKVGAIPQPVVITNESPVALTIKATALQGRDASTFKFTLNQCLFVRLSPGAACELYLSFLADHVGNHQANLVITTGGFNPPTEVGLSGVGLLPTAVKTPGLTP